MSFLLCLIGKSLAMTFVGLRLLHWNSWCISSANFTLWILISSFILTTMALLRHIRNTTAPMFPSIFVSIILMWLLLNASFCPTLFTLHLNLILLIWSYVENQVLHHIPFFCSISICLENCSLSSSTISNTHLFTASHEVINVGFPCKSSPEILSPPKPYVCISSPKLAPPFPTMSTNLTLPSPSNHLISTTFNPYVSISTPVLPLPISPVPCTSAAPLHPLMSSLTDICHAAAACLSQHLSCHPQPRNRYSASSLCPPVSADQCVILWTMPHSL